MPKPILFYMQKDLKQIKVLIALVSRLSLSVGWEMVLNGDLSLFQLRNEFYFFSKFIEV